MRKPAEDGNWSRPMIIIHWLTALAVLCLFPLGLWMTGLGYYDPWFQKGPYIHESVGILLLPLTLLRVFFRHKGEIPAKPVNSTAGRLWITGIVHLALYFLLLSVLLSGYLTSTADGTSIVIFSWLEIPATFYGLYKQEDIAGLAHLVLAIVLIVIVALHALAALKHHYLDRDHTLKRMFGILS